MSKDKNVRYHDMLLYSDGGYSYMIVKRYGTKKLPDNFVFFLDDYYIDNPLENPFAVALIQGNEDYYGVKAI